MAEYANSRLNGVDNDTYAVIATYQNGWFRSAAAVSDKREAFEVGFLAPIFENCRVSGTVGPERNRLSGEYETGYSAQAACNFSF